jgi:pyruvate dehydrogenase E2 component (dihydrolipoamide acetyltransferase)
MTEFPIPSTTYDVYGSAPPRYVLVHGIGGDRTQWRRFVRCLAIGTGVLAIDLAGHGAASHLLGPYRISRYAADVAEITSERVFDGAILIGHSMGAAVCLDAARILGGSVNQAPRPGQHPLSAAVLR